MESFDRLCVDIRKDGGLRLIVVMLAVKMVPKSWLHFEGLYHYYDFYRSTGYIAIAAQVYIWLPILGWRPLAIRQYRDYQHVSLVKVYDTDEWQLQQITAMLDDAMRQSGNGTKIEFLKWQPWPIYSTNALLWPVHHASIFSLMNTSTNISWYSGYNYHLVV